MPPKYKIINDWELGEELTHTDPASVYDLNRLGEEGWELITVLEVWVSIDPPTKGYRWIFKKVPI